MKVCKPMKMPVLTRVVEFRHKPTFHVTAMLGFPLVEPRALLDEMAFWAGVGPALGSSVLDEGISKSQGELLVAGRYFAPQGRETPAGHVRVSVGTIDKRLAVIGDRHWRGSVPSDPKPMNEMPIDWARAYGGEGFGRNPYGLGAVAIERDGEKVRPLPNLERYGALIRSPGDQVEPECLLPMDMTFEQRRARAGTFGFDYLDKYAPGLPGDHQPTVYNCANTDQWLAGMWRGDEAIVVEHMNPTSSRQESSLPGLLTRAFVTHKTAQGERFVELALRCDTVWLMPTVGIGVVVFHGSLPIATDDAADVLHLLAACEAIGHVRPAAHYEEALRCRLDKQRGALADLSDSDLMPSRESGVAPNIDLGPLGGWVKSEGFAMSNSRRGQKRTMEQRRQLMIDEGMDPEGFDVQLPEEEPPPPVEDLDALKVYLETMERRLEAEEANAKAREIEAKQRARDARAEFDMAIEEEAVEVTGGPPTFRAAAQYQIYVELAEVQRHAGAPNEEFEAKLADPGFREQLLRLEKMTREGYAQGAHLMPMAAPMTAEANEIARSLIEVIRDADESLADRDFTGADFRGVDFSGMDLSRSFLEGADLRDARLIGANLSGAVLARADLRGADLRRATLVGANLGGSDLRGASLGSADLSKAILMRAQLDGANFAHASFKGADLMEVAWLGADIAGADFEQCTFLKADLSGVSFVGANLVQATLLECTLDGTDFSEANLHKASFVTCTGQGTRFVRATMHEAVILHQSSLPEADFSDALLERSCLRTTALPKARFLRARLGMVDLSECDCVGAVFDEAQLQNALLIRTDLRRASLRGVNLTEALVSKSKLAGADFSGSQLTRADFTRAVGDAKTRFTDCVVHFTRFDKHPTGEATP